MKGPRQRFKYDGRRLWHCPACGHRHRTLGSVTAQLCNCQNSRPPQERVWMQLVDEGFPLAKVALPPGPE